MKTSKPSLTVIPAQAGIQSIEYHPTSGTTAGIVRCAECLLWLDSGLRRNDGTNGGQPC